MTTTADDPRSRTALCARCATLIRYWPPVPLCACPGIADVHTVGARVDGRRCDFPADPEPAGVWRHASIEQGLDHAPEPMEDLAR